MADIVQTVVAIVIGLILIIGVAVPVAVDVINNQSFTGTNSLVANQIPLFLILGGLLLATGLFGFSGFSRGRRR